MAKFTFCSREGVLNEDSSRSPYGPLSRFQDVTQDTRETRCEAYEMAADLVISSRRLPPQRRRETRPRTTRAVNGALFRPWRRIRRGSGPAAACVRKIDVLSGSRRRNECKVLLDPRDTTPSRKEINRSCRSGSGKETEGCAARRRERELERRRRCVLHESCRRPLVRPGEGRITVVPVRKRAVVRRARGFEMRNFFPRPVIVTFSCSARSKHDCHETGERCALQ